MQRKRKRKIRRRRAEKGKETDTETEMSRVQLSVAVTGVISITISLSAQLTSQRIESLSGALMLPCKMDHRYCYSGEINSSRSQRDIDEAYRMPHLIEPSTRHCTFASLSSTQLNSTHPIASHCIPSHLVIIPSSHHPVIVDPHTRYLPQLSLISVA